MNCKSTQLIDVFDMQNTYEHKMLHSIYPVCQKFNPKLINLPNVEATGQASLLHSSIYYIQIDVILHGILTLPFMQVHLYRHKVHLSFLLSFCLSRFFYTKLTNLNTKTINFKSFFLLLARRCLFLNAEGRHVLSQR